MLSSVIDDLARRDFTVNAMAYNESAGLVDPFGGEKSLRENVIACVGDPDERFKEDALRILRALRFSSAYGFKIEDKTSEAVRKNKDLLTSSKEPDESRRIVQPRLSS